MRDDYQTVGDIAYRDDEGYVYICDRKKDMIISGGMNIYPAEIEAALEAHPDIYDAAVFGIPQRGVGRDRCTPSSSCAPGAGADRGRRDGASPASTSPATRCPRSVTLHRRAAQDRLRQDPQARAPRPVLGRPTRPGRLSPDARRGELAARGVDVGAPVARTVALTPRSRRRSRNATTPVRGVPGVGQPGVGLSGIRLTWAPSGSGRARPARSASLRRSLTPSISAHSNDSRRPLGREVACARGDHVVERIAAVDRHELVAQLVVGGVQRHGQVHRQRARRRGGGCRARCRPSRP